MKDNNEIPIVLATDENYFLYTCVAIQSILSTTHTPVHIYVMVDSAISEHIKKRILDLNAANVLEVEHNCALDNRKQQHKVELILVDDSAFDNIHIAVSTLSKETFFRLLISSRLPQYDKCIYLDGDVLVREDLSELLNLDMNGNYIAGVKDYGMYTYRQDVIDGLNIGDSTYINAGVIVMNLAALRLSGTDKHMIEECSTNSHIFYDQDVINKCCAGHILTIDSRYNYMHSMQKEYEFNPVVVHYAGSMMVKPWNSSRVLYADEWYVSAQLVCTKEELKLIDTNRIALNDAWRRILEACKCYNNRYIWGCGDCGRYLVNLLISRDIDIHGIIETDNRKVGTKYYNVPIVSVDSITDDNDTLIIISSWKYHKAIMNTIKNNGLNCVKLELYSRKERDYYKFIDEKYYLEELQELLEQVGIK